MFGLSSNEDQLVEYLKSVDDDADKDYADEDEDESDKENTYSPVAAGKRKKRISADKTKKRGKCKLTNVQKKAWAIHLTNILPHNKERMSEMMHEANKMPSLPSVMSGRLELEVVDQRFILSESEMTEEQCCRLSRYWSKMLLKYRGILAERMYAGETRGGRETNRIILQHAKHDVKVQSEGDSAVSDTTSSPLSSALVIGSIAMVPGMEDPAVWAEMQRWTMISDGCVRCEDCTSHYTVIYQGKYSSDPINMHRSMNGCDPHVKEDHGVNCKKEWHLLERKNPNKWQHLVNTIDDEETPGIGVGGARYNHIRHCNGGEMTKEDLKIIQLIEDFHLIMPEWKALIG